MKLYLSSYRIPTPQDFQELAGKPLHELKIALIPNAKDFYTPRPWTVTNNELVHYMNQLGFSNIDTVDLRNYNNPTQLKNILLNYDVIWARGGNTYMLRYEMQRSGFDKIIGDLLESGIIYGGDSAGALVAGTSIAGVEVADNPAFAESIVNEGLHLIPFVILPHADNPEFSEVMPIFKATHKNTEILELKDSQAVIFQDNSHRIVEASA